MMSGGRGFTHLANMRDVHAFWRGQAGGGEAGGVGERRGRREETGEGGVGKVRG